MKKRWRIMFRTSVAATPQEFGRYWTRFGAGFPLRFLHSQAPSFLGEYVLERIEKP